MTQQEIELMIFESAIEQTKLYVNTLYKRFLEAERNLEFMQDKAKEMRENLR